MNPTYTHAPGFEGGPLSQARQARVDELERASEELAELRGLVAERDRQLAEQIAENAVLAQQVTDLKALIEHTNTVAREREQLVGQAHELLRQWAAKT